MEFSKVSITVPLWIPTVLLDVLVVPLGALWLAAMLVYDELCRDEHGQLQ